VAVFTAGNIWLHSKQSNAEDSSGSIFYYISSDNTPKRRRFVMRTSPGSKFGFVLRQSWHFMPVDMENSW
jgi:hypothetical protein